jgi:hypothetical protein
MKTVRTSAIWVIYLLVMCPAKISFLRVEHFVLACSTDTPPTTTLVTGGSTTPPTWAKIVTNVPVWVTKCVVPATAHTETFGIWAGGQCATIVHVAKRDLYHVQDTKWR